MVFIVNIKSIFNFMLLNFVKAFTLVNAYVFWNNKWIMQRLYVMIFQYILEGSGDIIIIDLFVFNFNILFESTLYFLYKMNVLHKYRYAEKLP